jgi:hypothetical protein
LSPVAVPYRAHGEAAVLGFGLTVVWIGVAGTTLLWGLDYYRLPLDERAFSPLAPLFAPTGLVGHGFGIVGTAMIVIGVVGYAVRKRSVALARLGALRHWLTVHIFLCTLGPYLVLLHTTFKFGGLVSVSFWSMAIVVVSGVFGRYVYVRIPKTLNGSFLGMEAIRARVQELGEVLGERGGLPLGQLEAAMALPAPDARRPGLASSLLLAMIEDVRGLARRVRVRRMLHAHAVPRALHPEVLRLTREQARLRQQTLILDPFRRLFRYWHVIHLPLAIVMFLILGVHVAVAILFGYTWIF